MNIQNNFHMYQTEARKTAIYPREESITYPALGLAGEVGEVCERIKKAIRGDFKIFDDEPYKAIEKELGDVLWYLAALASELHLSLGDIAQMNINKLKDREKRNVLQGDGDER